MSQPHRQPGPFAAGSRAVLIILGVAGIGMLVGVPLLLNSPSMSNTLINAVEGGRQFKEHEHELTNSLASLDRSITANEWPTVARIADRALGQLDDMNRSDGRWSSVMLWRIRAAQEIGDQAQAASYVRAWWDRLIEVVTWREILHTTAPRLQDVQLWRGNLKRASTDLIISMDAATLTAADAALAQYDKNPPSASDLARLRTQASSATLNAASVANDAAPSQ